jgi:hypothetical protein
LQQFQVVVLVASPPSTRVGLLGCDIWRMEANNSTVKMGGMMGGSTLSLRQHFRTEIFGATNIIRFGPGPNGMMRTLGQYMVGSAATFGYENREAFQQIAGSHANLLLDSSCPSAQPSVLTARPS